MPSVPTLKLSTTGDAMPIVGTGLWKVPIDNCAESVYQAIKAGYRMFDSSSDYGNESKSGEGLKRAIDEGLVKREDVFIVTSSGTLSRKQKTLSLNVVDNLPAGRLITVFDLYLVHFPIALAYVDPSVRYSPEWHVDGKSEIKIERSPLHLTWAAMEKLVDQKLVRNLGVCSFPGALLMDLMTYARIPPSVHQVEMHPYNIQEDQLQLCKAFDLKMMAFCSFGPASWVELDVPTVKQVDPLFTHPIITKIAEKVGRTPGQVLLRWATQRGFIVIPKSIKPERMAENLNSTDFNLGSEDLQDISSLDRRFRFGDPKAFDPRLSIFA